MPLKADRPQDAALIHYLDQIGATELAGFDAVIDVRTPAEFAEDHATGAINLPVMSNEQRAEVGTIFVQESAFRASRIGAAHVARNVAGHLEGALADQPKSFRPLIYCWRGGQRSNAMATVLAQVGWKTTVLRGGYMTWRRHVQKRLYEDPLDMRLMLLDGDTGSGKTELLALVARRGVQTIDLEGLAEHRGSLFGSIPGRPQPSQKMFESRLLAALDALDPARTVLVEAEANKIGERLLPPSLRIAMQGAPRMVVEAPTEERAAYLARAYADLTASAADLQAAITRMGAFHGPRQLQSWSELAETQAYAELAASLMATHYDPAYRRAAKKRSEPVGAIRADDLTPRGLEVAAEAIAAFVLKSCPPVPAAPSDVPTSAT